MKNGWRKKLTEKVRNRERKGKLSTGEQLFIDQLDHPDRFI